MEETYLLNHPGVTKKILHGGHGPLPHFPNGTKLVFHFQTLLDNFERTVIDDSRRNKQPTEIFVGKMFKMEVWEVLLTSMRIGEVAEFWCDATHTGLYAMVSKGMRLAAQGKDPLEGQRHTCGLGNMFHYHSTGFPELDELMRTPQPLIFIMELISVGDVFSYQRESWMMEKDEKLKAVPSLHFLGNALVKQGRYRDAADKYKEAILLLRTVQSREMPGDEDYIHLSRMIIPLVLNYCQCMLELEEYYEVIEHTTELLDKHKDCVKAYYKRAKAYAAVWSEKEARKDFQMVANLDVTLSKLVHRELGLLSERMKEKYYEDKERYWNILEAKEEKERREDDARDVEEEERSQSLQEFKAAEEEKSPSRVEDGPSRESGERTSSTEDKDWQQMLRLIMLLQDEGNFYVKEHRFAEATGKFTEALEYIDRLQTKVEHKGEDWDSLEKVGLPLRLNLSQCKLELGDFREVVDLNDKLLKSHKDHLKAVYQRARAHAALCNEDQARRDFNKVLQLDPTFKPIVTQEIRKLGEKLRQRSANDNQNYWTSTKEKWEKKAKSKRAKQSDKKGVTWADESEISGGKVDSGESSQGKSEGQEGISHSGGSSRVSTGDEDEKQSSLDGKEESSVTLRGDHQEKDGMERTKVWETDSKSEGNLLNIHNTEKKHDQDTAADQIQASPESSSPSSSGEKTLLRPTDVPGDEKTEGGGADVEVEMGKEEISTKSEKRSKKRKPKKK